MSGCSPLAERDLAQVLRVALPATGRAREAKAQMRRVLAGAFAPPATFWGKGWKNL